MPWEIERINTIGAKPIIRIQMPYEYLEILLSSDLWDQLKKYVHDANRKENPMSYEEAIGMINEIKGVKSKIDFIAAVADAETEEEAMVILSCELKNMIQTMSPEEIATWLTDFTAKKQGGLHYHIELDIPIVGSD